MGSTPAAPFVGIRPYWLEDADIFFEREQEIGLLNGLILAHRMVLLYGDSGNGKSSLLNAGLVPTLRTNAPDFHPERLRVNAALSGFDAEIKPLSTPQDAPFHSLLTSDVGNKGDRFTIAADALKQSLLAAFRTSDGQPRRRVLLMFDQFEELYTFGGGRAAFSLRVGQSVRFTTPERGAEERQRQVALALGALLSDDEIRALPVKFLFVFREEFLSKLLALVPELNNATAFRLAPLSTKTFPRIIAGPFLPKGPFHTHAAAKFFRDFAADIGAQFASRAASIGQNTLTDIQIFCSEAWTDDARRSRINADPHRLPFEITAVLADFHRKSIDRLGEVEPAAIALLCEMVTSSKTRNIVSEASLLEKLGTIAQQDEPAGAPSRFAPRMLQTTLAALVTNKIINESERNGAKFYDLASEALIPWLSEERGNYIEKIEKRQRDVRATRRRQQVLALFSVISAAFAIWAVAENRKADSALHEARVSEKKATFAQAQAERARWKAETEKVDAIKLRDLASAKAEEAERRSAKYAENLALVEKELERQGASKEQAQATTRSLANPLVARLPHDGAVTAACFSRDGKWVATGSADKRVRVWTTAGAAVGANVASASAGGVSALTFTPDSRAVITGSSGESVRLFTGFADGETLRQLWSLDRLADTVTWLEFSPTGDQGVCASGGGTATLLSWRGAAEAAKQALPTSTPRILTTWQHTRGQAVSVARFSADGSRLVTSSDDGKLRVFRTQEPYDLVPDNLLGNPIDLRAPTRGFRFSPVDSSLVVGGAGTRKVVWWRIGSGQTSLWRDEDQAGLTFHKGAVLDVAFQPSGDHFASVATDGRCIVWESATMQSIAQVPTEIRGRLFHCDWSGDLLALTGEDGWLEIWNMANPAQPAAVFSTRAHERAAWGVSFSPGGDLLLTWSNFPAQNIPSAADKATKASAELNLGGSDNTAALWDVKWCEQNGWTRR